MLHKCANPSCSAQFRYLHQGKLFHLSPTPEVEAFTAGSREFLYERFWLCDECSKKMKIVWDGLQAKIVELPPSHNLVGECDDDLPRRRPIGNLRAGDPEIR